MSRDNEDDDGVIRGVRAIAKYMGVSPTTITRWRRRFKGQTDVKLCFPAMEVPTGRGWSWSVLTHITLIEQWMERWCEIDGQAFQNRDKRANRNAKVVQIGGTGKSEATTSLAAKSRPSLHEELARLTPAEREWIVKHELTPAQRQELRVKTAERADTPASGGQSSRLAHTKRCSCGTPEPCTAHD